MIQLVWNEYTAKVAGSTLKVTTCSNCAVDYVYEMHRRSSATGTSMYFVDTRGASQRAETRAQAALLQALENDCDPVPCPACGHYQADMIPQMREAKWQWVLPTSVSFTVIGLVVLAGILISTSMDRQTVMTWLLIRFGWPLVGLSGAAAVGLPVVKRFWLRRFDPNQGDPAGRIALGQSLALTREAFEARLGDSGPASPQQLGASLPQPGASPPQPGTPPPEGELSFTGVLDELLGKYRNTSLAACVRFSLVTGLVIFFPAAVVIYVIDEVGDTGTFQVRVAATALFLVLSGVHGLIKRPRRRERRLFLGLWAGAGLLMYLGLMLSWYVIEAWVV